MVLNRGRSGSKSLANMMPPEYCHSCKGDGVCADTTCDRPPHRSSARKYSGRERTLRGISKTPNDRRHSIVAIRCILRRFAVVSFTSINLWRLASLHICESPHRSVLDLHVDRRPCPLGQED